jgi:hypothetical protein
MMFGQVPTASEGQVLTVLLGGAAVLGIVYLGLGVWDKAQKLMGRNRRVQFEPVETAATREDVESLRLEMKRDMNEIHNRITGVSETVEYLRGKFDAQI